MTEGLRAIIRRFRRDEEGVSALEFAIIAPLMILLYLGSVDLSLAFSIDRKVTSATSAVADLVAQDDVITDAEIADIMAAGSAILAPFPTDPLNIRVTSVLADGNGDTTVQWSDSDGLTPYVEDQSIDMPEGVVPANTSIIMVEMEYRHDTLFGQLGVSEFEITETFYLRPRQTIVVSRA